MYDINLPLPDTVVPKLNTVILDSIAADTVAGRIPHFLSKAEAEKAEIDSLAANMARMTLEIPSGLSEGIAPTAKAPTFSGNTPLGLLLIGILVLAAFNRSAISHTLSRYRSDLWSMRRRRNVFDDSETVSFRGVVILSLIFFIFGGVVMFYLPAQPAVPSFSGICAMMSLLAIYYLFQICAYNVVGYAFSDPLGRKQWVGGFMASQAYTGILTIIPAFLILFFPPWRQVMVVCAISIYIIARMVFICKGFRIFYTNFGAIVYFILYLCTLEILPVLAVYKGIGIIASYSY